MTATLNACAACSTPADACSWSQNPLEDGGDCCGTCAHDIGLLTFEQIAALRDQAQRRLDDANGRLAWIEAAAAVVGDPEGDGR